MGLPGWVICKSWACPSPEGVRLIGPALPVRHGARSRLDAGEQEEARGSRPTPGGDRFLDVGPNQAEVGDPEMLPGVHQPSALARLVRGGEVAVRRVERERRR